mgnify:CR=1 FL=1
MPVDVLNPGVVNLFIIKFKTLSILHMQSSVPIGFLQTRFVVTSFPLLSDGLSPCEYEVDKLQSNSMEIHAYIRCPFLVFHISLITIELSLSIKVLWKK